MYIILRVFLILALFVFQSNQQFYRGELEPKYSRKTPYRQQTDIPDAVFGIGHGIRRFGPNKDKSLEEPSSFFGRREPDRRNTGREDGRHFEENGDDTSDDPFGRSREENGDRGGEEGGREGYDKERRNRERPTFIRGPFDREEGGRRGEGRDGQDGGRDGIFTRPRLPDPDEVKERFDEEREQRKEQEHGKNEGGEDEDGRGRGRGPNRNDRRNSEETDDNEHDRRKEQKGKERRREKEEEREGEEGEDGEEGRRGREGEGDEHGRGNDRHEEKDGKVVPTKIVGLNMQMVAGLFPKEKKGPEVEDVEKRGGRFVDKPDERNNANLKFFRGQTEKGKGDRGEESRSTREDSGEVDRRKEHNRRREEHDQREKHGKTEKDEEGGRRREEDRKQTGGGHSGEQQQQQQQQPPPPPKPQIPPFPAFPKFPGFGGFQPYQPDFPSRRFGGDGGFTGSPWNESGRSTERKGPTRENTSTDEDRHQTDRSDSHKSDTSTITSDDTSTNDESTERRHSRTNNGKENDRRREEEGRKGEGEEGKQNTDIDKSRENHKEMKIQKDGREKEGDGIEEEEEEEEKEIMKKEDKVEIQQVDNVPRMKKEFPTPGRFTTNIRAKKSGELLNVTPSPSTTISLTTINPLLSTTISSPSSIILPTESIIPIIHKTNDSKHIKVA